MLNRSEIMKAAWQNYRDSLPQRRPVAPTATCLRYRSAIASRTSGGALMGAAREARIKAHPTYQELKLAYDATLVAGGIDFSRCEAGPV